MRGVLKIVNRTESLSDRSVWGMEAWQFSKDQLRLRIDHLDAGS